ATTASNLPSASRRSKVTRGRTATRRRGTHRPATRRRRATHRLGTPRSRATLRRTRSRRPSSSSTAAALPSWRDAWLPSAAAVSWTPASEDRGDGCKRAEEICFMELIKPNCYEKMLLDFVFGIITCYSPCL
ncbi:Os07g0585500, partial [Oryza sativa Japonica Group]